MTKYHFEKTKNFILTRVKKRLKFVEQKIRDELTFQKIVNKVESSPKRKKNCQINEGKIKELCDRAIRLKMLLN